MNFFNRKRLLANFIIDILVGVLLSSKSPILATESPTSENQIRAKKGLFSGKQDNEQDNIHLISTSIASISRHQFEGIPTLIQKLDIVKGVSEYHFSGESSTRAVITTNNNEQGQEIIIFPSGEYGFGSKKDKSYVVLRKSKGQEQNATYFLNIVYLRTSGKQKKVEWSTIEKDHHWKSPLEVELCRKEQCEFPEWIFGTCQIIEHSCVIKGVLNDTNGDLRNGRSLTRAKNGRKRSIGSGSFSISEQQRKSIDENEASQVPSSLDLLMRPKKSKETEEDSSFKKTAIKAREVDNNQIEFVDERCVQCQTIGDFFSDLEDQSLDLNKLVGKRIKEEQFSKQETTESITNLIKLNPHVPYIGFGDCNYSLEESDRPQSKEIDDIVEFFLGTMKKDCDHVAQSDMRGWLTSKLKFFRIEEDLSLSLVANSPLLKSELFSAEEFGMVMSALLVSVYSDVYYEERAILSYSSKNPPTRNPIGLKISKMCQFQTKLFLRLVSTVYKVMDNHLVKSLRTIIRYLKDKILSLLVERIGLPTVPEPPSQATISRNDLTPKEINTNDLNQFMALKEFVLYGLGPFVKSGTSPHTAFDSFYKTNQKRIEVLVKALDN